MAFFIGQSSSGEYLRTLDGPGQIKPSRAFMTAQPPREQRFIHHYDLSRHGIIQEPVHLLVPDSDSRSKLSGIAFHVWKQPEGCSSFTLLERGLYCCTPEAHFFQMAQSFDVIELAKLGFELCGSYRLTPSGLESKEPLMTVASLRQYLDCCRGLRGYKRASAAARYVQDNSASPMETALALMLGLPAHLGGCGLGMPTMNAAIKAPNQQQASSSHDLYHCDLYWHQGRIGIEYDSVQFHSSSNEHARDARRRNDMESFGVRVLTVTWKQAASLKDMEVVARQIAKRTRHRLRCSIDDYPTRKIELWKRVLPPLR